MRQAENDVLFARSGFRDGFYAQSCFMCQQVGDKAGKALHHDRGARFVPGHSVHHLLKTLQDCMTIDREILEAAGILDQFHISAGYPNGLPDGAPFEVYSREQARQALEGAGSILEFVSRTIGQADNS